MPALSLPLRCCSDAARERRGLFGADQAFGLTLSAKRQPPAHDTLLRLVSPQWENLKGFQILVSFY